MARRWKLLGGGAVIAGALTYLVAGGIGDNLVYFVTPDELLAKGEAAYGAPVRLAGRVEPGSVKWDAEAVRLRFGLGEGGIVVPVESRGAPPQMFQEGIHVIVEGSLERGGLFRAHNLMVKHSNEYEPPAEGEPPPEVRYRQLMETGRPGGSP